MSARSSPSSTKYGPSVCAGRTTHPGSAATADFGAARHPTRSDAPDTPEHRQYFPAGQHPPRRPIVALHSRLLRVAVTIMAPISRRGKSALVSQPGPTPVPARMCPAAVGRRGTRDRARDPGHPRGHPHRWHRSAAGRERRGAGAGRPHRLRRNPRRLSRPSQRAAHPGGRQVGDARARRCPRPLQSDRLVRRAARRGRSPGPLSLPQGHRRTAGRPGTVLRRLSLLRRHVGLRCRRISLDLGAPAPLRG